MVEKMLRVATRGEDGTAKPLQTDAAGSLKIKTTGGDKRYLMQIGTLTTGKNLFNKSTAIADSSIPNTGITKVEPGWYHTDYIAVHPGNTIVFSKVTSSAGVGTAFYEDGVFKSFVSNATIKSNSDKVLVPSGVNQMRSTAMLADIPIDTWQIEIGQVSTPYENFREFNSSYLQQKKMDDLISQTERSLYAPGKNLFNKAVAKSGHYINASGLPEPSSSWIATDFMPVYPGEKIFFRSNGAVVNGMNDSTIAGVAFYDRDRTFISWKNNTTINADNGTIEVLDRAWFMRASGAMTALDTWQVTTDNENPEAYEPFQIKRGGNGGGSSTVNFAVTKTGQPVSVTTEEDEYGKSVLRVVDSAPFLAEITGFDNATHASVTVATTSVLALDANAIRKYALIENTSDQAVFLAYGIAAEGDKGIKLNPSEKIEMSAMKGNLYKGAINAIGAVSHVLLVTEGY